MKIMQIGNGGAFDFDKTNSSFLIYYHYENMLLFDCGWNVFSKLRKLESEEKIDLSKLCTVYISHMDDDHMGSLKTLIYYQYFIHGIKLTILADGDVKSNLEVYLADLNGYRKYNEFHKDDLFTLKHSNTVTVNNTPLIRETFKTSHHTECYGAVIGEGNKNVCISGDTKAIPHIIETIDKKYKFNKIYHDFSNWNSFHEQVHCCHEDWMWYEDTLRLRMIKYHNGEDYEKDWIEL